jgi:glycosyltransferase involved in cell wall biosynthesis
MRKLAIVTTHPIQYYAPVFKLLHQRGQIGIKVFYTWGASAQKKHDPGFGKDISWDIPLLEGYPFEWVNNTSANPGSHHFKGIVTPGLTGQIKLWQPDAVLFIGWAYHSHLTAIRYFKNKLPVFFRGDSTMLDEQKGFKSLFKSFFLKWVYHHIDHAFYVGTNNKAYFKKYGLKDAQLSFAPHAIDNDRFGIDRHNEALQLRKSLTIASSAIVILFAGKLEEKKSPVLLLDAFVQAALPGTHLIFAGNGDLEKPLRHKAANHKNIHFLDFQNQSDMPVVYQACNLFCLPSKGPAESWGLAVNEAMACKKAILVSNKCGCAIDLVTAENGKIFESENLDDLISAIKSLVSGRDMLVQYGENSATRIKPWNFLNIATAIEKRLDETS